MKFLKLFIFFIFNSIILLSGCSSIDTNLAINEQISSSEMVPDELKRIPVNVVRVVDGDTAVVEIRADYKDYLHKEFGIRVEEPVTIRFLGIDTPESTKEQQLYGVESKEYTTLLLNRDNVEIELDDKVVFDKYGRLLVHIFADGQSVQQILLEEGMARIAYIFDDYKYLDNYKAAQEQAKNSQKNIWSIPEYVTDTGFNMDVLTEYMVGDEMSIENIDLDEVKTFIQSLLD